MLGPALALAMVGAASAAPSPVDAEVRALIASRVAVDPRLAGVVIGLERAGQRAVIGWGSEGAAGTPVPDGDTVFEIGSVTKVFAARLLEEKAAGALDAPAETWFGKRLPRSAAGTRFTLRQLAEHRSGLPRLPGNMPMANPADPYADYGKALFEKFLSGHILVREPGTLYEYSNAGYGLVGLMLEEKTGSTFAGLVQARVAGPLGMTRTAVSWTKPMARGHDLSGDPVPRWNLNALMATGAIHSTVNDLLAFAADTASKPGAPLGWIDEGFFWHNGMTGGFSSFVGFHRASGTKVVVLSNSSVAVDDIGRHLLDASKPLAVPPPARPEVVVASALLDEYAGRYELTPAFIITVRREGAGLTAQATGQPAFRVFASSDSDFFFKVVEASITFHRDESGKVARLVLHQNGDQTARRLP